MIRILAIAAAILCAPWAAGILTRLPRLEDFHA